MLCGHIEKKRVYSKTKSEEVDVGDLSCLRVDDKEIHEDRRR